MAAGLVLARACAVQRRRQRGAAAARSLLSEALLSQARLALLRVRVRARVRVRVRVR